MEFLLPAILGVTALAYVFLPLYAGASKTNVRSREAMLYGLEQLDLDYDLGKIDENEWKARRPALAAMVAPKRSLVNIETLIRGARKARRAELAVEAEVLVARAKKGRVGG